LGRGRHTEHLAKATVSGWLSEAGSGVSGLDDRNEGEQHEVRGHQQPAAATLPRLKLI
jgi:hypothetical protein